MTEFTSEERSVLAPYVTNLDEPVFALRNLPEVVKGALFSRYSRTDKSLRRVLLDEFIQAPEMGFKEIAGHAKQMGEDPAVAIQKAEEFYDRVLVGYGDDSVAELGGASVACEQVSQIAAKALEDSRLGLSPLEKSTRYVFFNQKNERGEYRYYRDAALLASKHADAYLGTNDFLFDAYSKLVEPLTTYFSERFPQQEGVSDRAYKSTLRAKACDTIRGLLPAAALTNVGIYGNGRAFEYLILKLYANDFAENRALAASLQTELSKVVPSFVKRANDAYGKPTQEYMKQARKAARDLARELLPALPTRAPEPASQKPASTHKPVALVTFDADAEEKVAAAILYAGGEGSLQDALAVVRLLSPSERARIISAYCGHRQNRRHRPGRAFENASYTFDFLANFGAYRDLQRHRVLTQERQALTTRHGFDVPRELEGAGFDGEFREAMKVAADAFDAMKGDFPNEAQYVIPLAYRVRWYATLNAREMYHLIELRSTRQGHPDYRKIAQEMHREMQRATPSLAAAMNFVDLKDYDLERLESEKGIDRKLAAVEKKYGASGGVGKGAAGGTGSVAGKGTGTHGRKPA